MYFYKLLALGYEDHFETVYYSDTKYTQKQFENIVLGLYKEMCQEIIKEEPDSLCWFVINFKLNNIFWDYDGKFKEKMAKKGFWELNNILTGQMDFDLNPNGNDSYSEKLDSIFCSLDIDESCWDDNCQYNDRSDTYLRDECAIYHLKSHKIKNKTCDNCSHPLIESYCTGKTTCERWKWDGKESG